VIASGDHVRLPDGTVRKVAAARGDVLHFWHVVKQPDGTTHYWASAGDCVKVRWLSFAGCII
jgi:hypothetical protein